MASGRTVLRFKVLLVICLSYVIAQEASANNGSTNDDVSHLQFPMNHDEHQDRAGFFGFPNIFGGLGGSNSSNPFGQLFGSNGSDPFSQLASAFSQFIPGLSFLQNNQRSQRAVGAPGDSDASNETEDMAPHDRFFFSLFHLFNHHHHHNNNNNSNNGVPIGCNFTNQGGYSCAGCREQLICNSNNVGQIRICPYNTPYCYNGVCGTFVNSTCTNSTG